MEVLDRGSNEEVSEVRLGVGVVSWDRCGPGRRSPTDPSERAGCREVARRGMRETPRREVPSGGTGDTDFLLGT